MAKTRAQKAADVAKISDRFKGMKSAAFAQVSGLTMPQADELRKKAKEVGVEVFVAKKTLLTLAVKEAGIQNLDPKGLQGSILTAIGSDEVSAAKVINDFSKVKDAPLTIVAGVLEGNGISAQEVHTLASLPSKQELYAQVARVLNGPMTGFARVLSGNVRGLITVLDGIAKAK